MKTRLIAIICPLFLFISCATSTNLIDPFEDQTLLTLKNERVSLSTTAQQIKIEAQNTEEFLSQRVSAARTRANQLRTNGTIRKIILRVGQFAGGGGAIIFGLNDDGSNAAYSGAVAAAFTAIDEAWTSPSTEREACLSIVRAEIDFKSTPRNWVIRSNDSEFQENFASEYDEFYSRVGQIFGDCHYSLGESFNSKRVEFFTTEQ